MTRTWEAAALVVGFGIVMCGCSSASSALNGSGPIDASANVDDAQADAGSVIDAGADVDRPSDTYPAFDASAPRITKQIGGAILTTPNVVPIFFPGDGHESAVEAFLSKLPGSNYWSTISSEYGVTDITVRASIVRTGETPPAVIDDTEIAAYLADRLDGTHEDWGMPDPTAIYTFYFPSTTTVTEVSHSGTSCVDFGGYHFNVMIGMMPITYAVIPACPNFANLANIVDVVTSVSSHELLEAATDPQSMTAPAYGLPDLDHLEVTFFPGAELGDICAFEANTNVALPELGNATVQRIWSNVQAKAGHDPCVPAPSIPYFNAVPVFPSKVDLALSGEKYPVRGVAIPVGMSKTIDVDLFSDAPMTAPFSVAAEDFATLRGGRAELGLAFDRSSGVNGDKLHLTITALAAGAYGGSEFVILSGPPDAPHYAYGFVQN